MDLLALHLKRPKTENAPVKIFQANDGCFPGLTFPTTKTNNDHPLDGEKGQFNKIYILETKGSLSKTHKGATSLPDSQIIRPLIPLLSPILKKTNESGFLVQDLLTNTNQRPIRPKRCPRVSEKCRLCGTLSPGMTQIFSAAGTSKKIAEKISTLLQLQVKPNDRLPLNLCSQCSTRLEAAYSFYVTCNETDSSLKRQLVAEDVENSQKGRYIPLIFTEHSQKLQKSNAGAVLVDEKLVSVSKCIPENQRVVQVIEAVQAGLGNEVPLMARSRTVEDALELLYLPPASAKVQDFHCSKCDSNLVTSFELLEHDLQKFSCTMCQQRFCTAKLRNVHRSQVHQNLSCTDCKITFSSVGLLRSHRRQSPFSCECCDSKFHSKPDLQRHLTKVMQEKICDKCGDPKCAIEGIECQSERKIWDCDQCDCVFFNLAKFNQHMQQHNPVGNRSFQCHLCLRAFNAKNRLNQHMDEHFGVEKHVCAICGSRFSCNSRLAMHMDLHRGNKYECDTCKRQFQHKIHLMRHIRLKHLTICHFQCNICPKTFETKPEAMKHCHQHETETKASLSTTKPKCELVTPFKCPTCRECKSSPAVLLKHLDTHKAKDQAEVTDAKYLCHLCCKNFKSEKNLRTHVTMAHLRGPRISIISLKSAVIASSPKKFSCSTCQKSFRQLRDLNDHKNSVHSKIFSYSCDFCGKNFATNANKKVHTFGKKPQAEYPCCVCSEKFESKCQRDSHQRSHEQNLQRAYSCSFCKERFFKMSQLHGHMGKKHAHQTAKSVYCDVCGKGFNVRSKFKKHFNLHCK